MKKTRILPPWLLKKKNSKDKSANSSFSDQNFGSNTITRTLPLSFDEEESCDKITFIETVSSSGTKYLGYDNKIYYFTDFLDIAQAADDLLTFVNKSTDDKIPIGFDMEWTFSYQTGPYKTALIQLCASLDVCYLFQVWTLKTLPRPLKLLLEHDRVILHGVCIKNDIRKLRRDFPDIGDGVEKMINNCVDLGPYTNKVLGINLTWSMARLVQKLLKTEINKDKSVRASQWNKSLSQTQQLYAAIDVYASQLMFLKLKKIENKQLNEEIEKLEKEVISSFQDEDKENNKNKTVELEREVIDEVIEEDDEQNNTLKELEAQYDRLQKLLAKSSSSNLMKK